MNRKSDILPTLKKYSKFLRFEYVLVDFIAANVAFFLFDILRYYTYSDVIGDVGVWSYISKSKLIWEQILFPILMCGIYWLSGYYNYVLEKSRVDMLFTTLYCSIFTALAIYLTLLLDDRVQRLSLNYLMIGILFCTIFICTFFARLIAISTTISRIKRKGIRRNILIVGDSSFIEKMQSSIMKRKGSYLSNIIGCIILDKSQSYDFECKSIYDCRKLGELDSIAEICLSNNVDQVVIKLSDGNEKDMISILEQLFPLNITIKAIPDDLSFLSSRIAMHDVLADPVIDLSSSHLTPFETNLKRLLDVLVSLIAMILLSPVYLILAIMVKMESNGPVIYKQERLGKNRKPFMILKFRSMRVDAESEGPQLSNENDSRVTSLGKVLRKYRLDEILQFWNVIRGDMSIVGPRPEREFYLKKIIEKVPLYSMIFQLRPGITSWGMIKYGYASNVQEMVERTKYDLIYLKNAGLVVDLKIAIYTVLIVVKGKGK